MTSAEFETFVTQRMARWHGQAQSRLGDTNAADEADQDEGDATTIAQCEAILREALATLREAERTALHLSLTESRANAMAKMSGYNGAYSRAKRKMNTQLGDRHEVVVRLGEIRLRELLTEGLPSQGDSTSNQTGDEG